MMVAELLADDAAHDVFQPVLQRGLESGDET